MSGRLPMYRVDPYTDGPGKPAASTPKGYHTTNPNDHQRLTLTVAICARRAEAILPRCVAALRAQTVEPAEILVAVDEPDDPTAAVARDLGARVVVSGGTGLYEARNAVLAACTTDLLAFLDADCLPVPGWLDAILTTAGAYPGVVAGTGPHPPAEMRNLAAWLHHMWFLVETLKTGETGGVIGGNSWFRTKALREVGGWLPLGGHSAAEDMYISMALRQAGHTIWFDENMIMGHHYETRLKGLWRKAVMMGRDVVVMLRAAGWFGPVWWYTLAIPAMALVFMLGLLITLFAPVAGLGVSVGVLAVSYVYLAIQFRSLAKALPRWAARWLLIWPYSWGILKGLLISLPKGVRR